MSSEFVNGPPRVLVILDPSMDVTGAFICARNTARILGNDLDVCLALPAGSRIPGRYLEVFSEVYYLPMKPLRRSVSSVLRYLPMLFHSSWKLKRVLDRYPGCLLQVNDFYLMQGVGARLLGHRGPMLTWVRMEPGRFGGLLPRIWLDLGGRLSREVVAVSRFIQQGLPASLARRSRVVYDPVPLEDSPPSTEPGCEEGERRLVLVGNYIQGKGQDLALRAFLDIADDYPDASLHFHGGDMGLRKNMAYRDRLREMAQSHPRGHRVRFHGFAEDPGLIYRQSCMALNLSESESFSLTVLEACFHGIPVVATRSGGPEEIILDGQTGLLVPVGDREATKRAMRCLLDDPAKAREMGQAASRHVRTRFSPHVFREGLLELYGRALGEVGI